MSAAANNLYQDLSGVLSTSTTDPNPYNALIEACNNDPTEIRARYALHRNTRASNQRAQLLSEDFKGVDPDRILQARLDEAARPDHQKTGYEDPRNCLVIWVRPPGRVRQLVQQVQSMLKEIVPNMWFLPPQNLHMTALEIAHSLTPDQLAALVSSFKPSIEQATDYAYMASKAGKVARLENPMVSFDASAVALSFLPSIPPSADGKLDNGEQITSYTYHHLRRDLWDICSSSSTLHNKPVEVTNGPSKGELRAHHGVPIASRYVVPTMHLTIGRFVGHSDTTIVDEETKASKVDRDRVKQFVHKIDGINAWLEKEFWINPGDRSYVRDSEGVVMQDNGKSSDSGSWRVGEEFGLDCQCGKLWYGEGERIRIGRSIDT